MPILAAISIQAGSLGVTVEQSITAITNEPPSPRSSKRSYYGKSYH